MSSIWRRVSMPEAPTLCTTGPIGLYNGVAQIELWDPALIDVYVEPARQLPGAERHAELLLLKPHRHTLGRRPVPA